QHAQPLRPPGRRFPLSHHRAGAAPDPPLPARSGRPRPVARRPDPADLVRPQPAPGILGARPPRMIAAAMVEPAPPFSAAADGVRVAVRLTPRARRNRVEGLVAEAGGGTALKVAVTAVPEDGKANAALIALLAKEWGVAKSS